MSYKRNMPNLVLGWALILTLILVIEELKLEYVGSFLGPKSTNRLLVIDGEPQVLYQSGPNYFYSAGPGTGRGIV